MNSNEMWDYTAQTSEWLRGLECFQSSVARHLSPHGSVAAEETCGSCLVCPYLGMADELWQLMSEQPVKETACNEESAAWETDAIVFQIKLFPCTAGAILALAGSMCRWLSRGGLFWDHCLFVFRSEGKSKYLGPTYTCENVAPHI